MVQFELRSTDVHFEDDDDEVAGGDSSDLPSHLAKAEKAAAAMRKKKRRPRMRRKQVAEDRDGRVQYAPRDLNNKVALAYALTIHKAQGSE